MSNIIWNQLYIVTILCWWMDGWLDGCCCTVIGEWIIVVNLLLLLIVYYISSSLTAICFIYYLSHPFVGVYLFVYLLLYFVVGMKVAKGIDLNWIDLMEAAVWPTPTEERCRNYLVVIHSSILLLLLSSTSYDLIDLYTTIKFDLIS